MTKMKFPSTRTCLINDMLLFASNTTRESKQRRVRDAVSFALSNITQLNRVPKILWSKRKQAIRALQNIDKIGILDGLELLGHKPVEIDSKTNELSIVAHHLGLFVNRVNGRVVITRTPLTIKPSESRSLADMSPAERGTSSPELPLT